MFFLPTFGTIFRIATLFLPDSFSAWRSIGQSQFPGHVGVNSTESFQEDVLEIGLPVLKVKSIWRRKEWKAIIFGCGAEPPNFIKSRSLFSPTETNDNGVEVDKLHFEPSL